MKNNTVILLACLVAHAAVAEIKIKKDIVQLDNGIARMEINRFGGAISSFELSKQKLNPYSWIAKKWKKNDVSEKEGFFTCFDRLSFSSKEDQERGIPFHGEATSVEWTILDHTTSKAGDDLLTVECKLPLAKMTMVREICLFKKSSVCRITDRITNNNPHRKPYNILQHPSLAAPFLDDSVRIDSNAARGFKNTKDPDEMPGTVFDWPMAEVDGKTTDLRHLTKGHSRVDNLICEPNTQHGWGTVVNASERLLTGHLWNTKDYPWIRIWREWKHAEPGALGVEFSTTPLGIPLEEIVEKGDLLDLPTVEFLEPGQTVEKTFYTFLAPVPKNYDGVSSVRLENGELIIDAEGSAKEITLPCGEPSL